MRTGVRGIALLIVAGCTVAVCGSSNAYHKTNDEDKRHKLREQIVGAGIVIRRADGQEHSYRTFCYDSFDWFLSWTPETGDIVTALYDPDDPKRCTLYPARSYWIARPKKS